MTKYAASDFANARFAEHESGQAVAIRWTQDYAREPDGFWTYERPLNNKFSKEATHQEMADMDGWVPVPTKPTITESETIREEEAHGTNFWLGFRKGFERAGGQIIPDPPPTNLEKLLRIIGGFEVFDAEGREAAHQIAQILDNNNVIVKDN